MHAESRELIGDTYGNAPIVTGTPPISPSAPLVSIDLKNRGYDCGRARHRPPPLRLRRRGIETAADCPRRNTISKLVTAAWSVKPCWVVNTTWKPSGVSLRYCGPNVVSSLRARNP
jgi:hypothetical protein